MIHKTRRIPLKMIEVDLLIIPIVDWLNSFPGIFTLHSCQGDYLESGEERFDCGGAYVLFTGDNKKSFAQIDLVLAGFIKDAMEIDFYEGLIRYTFRFSTKWHRDAVIDLIDDAQR